MPPDYRELFMRQENALKEAMGVDRADRHDAGERGWKPPPRAIVAELDEENA